MNKPHIGTDNLIKILANIRNYIIEKGGTFLYNTKAENFTFNDGKVTEVICSNHNLENSNEKQNLFYHCSSSFHNQKCRSYPCVKGWRCN